MVHHLQFTILISDLHLIAMHLPIRPSIHPVLSTFEFACGALLIVKSYLLRRPSIRYVGRFRRHAALFPLRRIIRVTLLGLYHTLHVYFRASQNFLNILEIFKVDLLSRENIYSRWIRLLLRTAGLD